MDSRRKDLDTIEAQAAAMIDQAIAWAEVNSYTRNIAGIDRLADEVERRLQSLGARTERIAMSSASEVDSRGEVVPVPLARALRDSP